MTAITEYLAEQKRLAGAATEGPWAFAAAPAEGSDETAAEYLEGALTGDGPLFVVWVPETQGDPGGYRLTAATGDGPHASMDAEFIAAARESVPRMVAALEAVTALHQPVEIEPSDTICRECSFQLPNGRYFGMLTEWPCPTIHAVEAALGGEGGGE
ncbi:hypothetical protein [Leucobacter massiliensis]|uniref:Uncharacterized protein n=1 Tax=Leucobacter massiliensis TaxID=1686285 RepID=A0A2S9QQN4_9MICO|nr:hypothetical protein [Leucobacter massiliensis]PRI11901.1 hypothetical protein B4915_02150 [Leucobacter massiliensis]